MKALLGVAVALAMGCDDGGVKDKLASKEKERAAAADEAVGSLVQEYVQGLVTTFPEDPGAQAGEDIAIVAWRKKLAAERDLAKKAARRAKELEKTPSAPLLRDGALVFQAVDDYWIGREVKGPEVKKEWEEGYEESKKVAAKEGARERVPLDEHVKNMRQLAGEGPYEVVGDLEQVLPHLVHMYRYKSYPAVTQLTSFSPVWQAMFDVPRKTIDGIPEAYADYRDRLCADRLKEKCQVPYEYRDVVVKRVYLEALLERLDALAKEHEALGPLVAKVKPYLEKERDAAVVPEEYPVLPDTLAIVPSSPYTVLVAGDKGVTLESDDPEDEDERIVFPLLDARDDWDLSEEEATQLVEKLKAALSELSDKGAGQDYTSQIYLHLGKDVPVSLIGRLEPALEEKVKLLDFVGRRRADGSLKTRRMPGNVVDKEVRTAQSIRTPDGEWTCMPLASLADSNVLPDLTKHHVLVGKDQVVAGEAGKAELTAPIGGDLAPIGKWVVEQDAPTLIAVRGEVTYEQLHKVLSAAGVTCEDEACQKASLVSKLLLAVCGDVAK